MKTSKGCRILLFQHHSYMVTLNHEIVQSWNFWIITHFRFAHCTLCSPSSCSSFSLKMAKFARREVQNYTREVIPLTQSHSLLQKFSQTGKKNMDCRKVQQQNLITYLFHYGQISIETAIHSFLESSHHFNNSLAQCRVK